MGQSTEAQTTFSWFNGTSGQVWNASDANTGGRIYTLPSGLTVTVTIVDPNNRNCDPNLGSPHPYDATGSCTPFPGATGTELANIYSVSGSIVDPWDSDCDPIYTQTNGGYGLNYLTYGIKTKTSAEEVTLRFTFSRPIYLNNFTITDIDYIGLAYTYNNFNQYEAPGNSYQDEVRFIASGATGNVPLSFSNIGSALTYNSGTQTVKATYNTNATGDISPDNVAGAVTVSSNGVPITTLDIVYSNGPEDAAAEQAGGASYYNWWYAANGATNGVSDDQAIRVPGFTYTPCPDITFTANNVTTCEGSIALLSMFSANGGTSPYTYKWLNPSGVQVSSSQFYSISNVSTSQAGNYTAIVTDANGCYATKTVTLSVNTVTSSTIATDQSICSGGDPAAFTVTTAATGSGTLTYQWQSNTSGCGSSFSNISGATSATYDPPSGLTQTTYYRVITTSTLNGIPCFAISNCITVTVKPNPSVNQPTNQSVCVGGTTTAINFTGSAVAGTVYNWTNTNTSIGLAANGAGDINSFTVTNTGSSPTVATITVTPIANGCTGTARSFTITVYPMPTISTFSGGFTECVGGTQSLSVTAIGGTPPLTYQWQNGGSTGTLWINISGATASTYTPLSNSTGTTLYRVRVTSSAGSACDTLFSSAATVVVVSDPVVTISTLPTTVCVGASLTLNASSSGGIGSCTYQWQSSPDGTTWTNISGATTNSYTTTVLTTTTRYRAQLMACAGNGCCN
ncbi:MAG: hypothetical protein JNL70_05320 [Saprospiraceae bacterium]|nr:hypothetical protein [Saprospiraceae bacterium]